MKNTRWLKSTNAIPRTNFPGSGVTNSDSGLVFLEEPEAKEDIEILSSRCGGGYVGSTDTSGL
jgi:hypothetical protein